MQFLLFVFPVRTAALSWDPPPRHGERKPRAGGLLHSPPNARRHPAGQHAFTPFSTTLCSITFSLGRNPQPPFFAAPSHVLLFAACPGPRGKGKGPCQNGKGLEKWQRESRRLPIFPGRLQPSIFGTTELNYCVRNGNRWDLRVIGTGRMRKHSASHISFEGMHPQN